MTTLDDIKVTFFEECAELLEDMEAGLIEMSEGDHDAETLNAVFRAAHSIKGGAGAFAFNDLVGFAHSFETTLDEVRSGRLEPSEEVLAVFLRSSDVLSDLVTAARDGLPTPTEEVDTLVSELKAYVGAPDTPDAAEDDGPAFEPMALDFGDIDAGDDIDFTDEPCADDGCPDWQIEFRPFDSLYNRGNDPAAILRAFAEYGDHTISLDLLSIPELDTFEDNLSMASWRICVNPSILSEEIEQIFEFAEQDCELRITPPSAATLSEPDVASETDQISAPEAVDNDSPSAELADLKECETPPSEPDATAQDAAATSSPEAPATQPPSPPQPPAPPTKSGGNSGAGSPGRSKGSIRVELERVDRLINLVGELVVNQAMLSESVVESGLTANSSVASGLDEFKNLTRDVQDSVMAIRAQPVRSLFQRMSRIVREAATSTQKKVRLITEGESTEIDKTVIDLLADPLTHMIRNAIDHGLESPEVREEAGKPSEGRVTLSAAHKSGRVVIEIADDGAGINRERVLGIAIEKGLVPPDAKLSGSDIDNLLFLPGFSTASEVSNLSGRGVGMDVVKQAIQKLGGRIAINSTAGKGSAFTISLPLTLAVLDGMVVQVDGETLVVPLTSVVETLRPDPEIVENLGADGQVVHVRDSYVPILDVGRALGYCSDAHPDRDVLLLIESEQCGPWALALDVIVDQRQVVIKSLEDNYGHVDGIAAATILGNGRIALILDPNALIPRPDNSTGQNENQ